MYASESFEQSFRSNLPIIITVRWTRFGCQVHVEFSISSFSLQAVVGLAFVLLLLVFFVYDVFVQKRNHKIVAVAAKTNEIVASLFPEAVRSRLFEDKDSNGKKPSISKENDDNMIKKFLSGNAEFDEEVDEEDDYMYKSRPIADLYPETTIMFADVSLEDSFFVTLGSCLTLSATDCWFHGLELHSRPCAGVHSTRNFLQGL
jgi:Ca2+/Na+ antiporter